MTTNCFKIFFIFSYLILSLVSINNYQNEVNFYKIYLLNHEVGYEKSKIEKIGNKRIKYEVHSKILLKRNTSKVSIEKIQTFIESNEGEPIEFLFIKKEGQVSKEIKGKINKNFLLISNDNKKIKIPLEKNFFFCYGLQMFIENNIKKNLKKFTYSFYSQEFERIIKVDNIILEKEKEFVKIKSIHSIDPNIPLFEKRDLSGNLIEIEIPKLNIKKVLTLDNASEKNKDFLDFHSLSSIKTNRMEKGFSIDISQILYKIEFDNEIKIAEDDRQKIMKKDKNQLLLLVKRNDFYRRNIFSFEKRKLEEDYLKDNKYIKIHSPSVKIVLKNFKRDKNNSWELVEDIHQWIQRNIKIKSLNLGFASVPEILATREGDCSEYSVLFMGLLRACGIPAKICYGLVYEESAFYFHFWVELHLGNWIPFDPIGSDGMIDVGYVKLGDDSLNEITEAELGILLSSYLNVKRIEIINFGNKENKKRAGFNQ